MKDRLIDLCYRVYYATISFMLWIKRTWHRFRYTDFINQPRAISASVAVGDNDTKNIQEAIDTVAGTNTPEHGAYLLALADYNQKWYRFFIRKPFWVDGGTVLLNPGTYEIGTTLNMQPSTLLRGEDRQIEIKQDVGDGNK